MILYPLVDSEPVSQHDVRSSVLMYLNTFVLKRILKYFESLNTLIFKYFKYSHLYLSTF